MSTENKIPSFDTEAQAWNWLFDEVDDSCIDNERLVYFDAGPREQYEYDKKSESGCCGSSDHIVKIAGRLARIGCNYGH